MEVSSYLLGAAGRRILFGSDHLQGWRVRRDPSTLRRSASLFLHARLLSRIF
jgi:hypothetical protein